MFSHLTRAACHLGSIALICLLTGTGLAQTTTSAPVKIRVAVVDFAATADLGISDAGRAVGELLLTELGSGAFQVVERSQLSAVLEEHKLSMADVVKNPALLGKNLKGVDYLVTGSVVKLGSLSITARLVDIKTGDIVRTAKVSAKDAQGLESAIGGLARQIEGVSGRGKPATMTLELYAVGYGRMVYKDQSLRCGANQSATFKDFPCLDSLEFLPDGPYKPGDVVKCTVATKVKGVDDELPVGTTAVIVEEAKDFDQTDGKVYHIKWKGLEDKPQTVSARWIEPVKRTAAAMPFQLSPWYRDRASLRGVFASIAFKGTGVYGADLKPADSLEAGQLAAAADAVRQMAESSIGIIVRTDPKAPKLGTASECDFNGIIMKSRTVVDQTTAKPVTESDTIRLEIPDIQNKAVTIETEDFSLKNPDQSTGKGLGLLVRERLELLCKTVLFTQDDKAQTVTVEGTYSGVVGIPADMVRP